MPNFKIIPQNNILQVGEVLVLLTGNTPCHSHGLRSAVYDLVRMLHGNGKVSFLLIANDDMHLVRYLDYISVPIIGKGDLCLLKCLELHEMILRNQESVLEVRHEDTSTFQD